MYLNGCIITINNYCGYIIMVDDKEQKAKLMVSTINVT